MSAGMVSVPTIVPLKAPGTGRKWEIDTKTPIEMSSSTKNTIIYYTADGSKPDPFKKIGQNSTYKYTKPIYLGVGKITLKAMAVLSDGSKESRVNTKMFQIREAQYEIVEDEDGNDEVDEDEYESREQYQSLRQSFENSKINEHDFGWGNKTSFGSTNGNCAWKKDTKDFAGKITHNNLLEQICSSGEDDFRAMKSKEFSKAEDSGVRKVLNGLELQKIQFSVRDEGKFDYDMMGSSFAYPRTAMPPKSGVTAKYTDDEFHLARCLYCHAVRPADPCARFCIECAAALPPVPSRRSLPQDEQSSVTCPICFANVPTNSATCPVCQKNFQEKIQENSALNVEKVVCLQCGTLSPSGSRRCVVCESVLPVQKVFTQHVVNKPPQPSRESFLQCSKCGRVNSIDARFCDWCGAKPLSSSSVVTCITCRTNNQPYAKYCAACGHNIAPPARPDYSSLYPNQSGVPKTSTFMPYSGNHAKWISLSAPLPKADQKTYGTQTTGIYFPSSRTIDAQCKDEEDSSKPKRPMSAMSPGKGYWRQQIDHVSQHLKIFTQNNIEFRDSISHLKIGKLLGAIAQEELNGQELCITLSFSLRNKDNHTLNATAKAVQHGAAFINALKNSKNTKITKGDSETKKKKIKKKGKKHMVSKDAKLSAETLKLFKMLSDVSEVEVDMINELIDSGSDVNAVNSEGFTPLKQAVTSKHTGCIQALVDAGANVDAKSGPKGNTALHEAVRLGLDGTDAVEKLLDVGADQDTVNDAGQTPYDFALKSGIDSIITKFTAKLGQDLLSQTIS